MVDVIILAFTAAVAYGSFKAGAKFGTIEKAWAAAKAWAAQFKKP